MKKLYTFIMFILLLSSCSVADLDNSRCMETVTKKYPESRVIPIPDQQYRFIVISNEDVRYVSVRGKYTEITSDILLSRICNR